MNSQNSLLRSLSRLFWCLGFCFVTFDRALVWEIGSYTLKLSFPLFLTAFLFASTAEISQGGLRSLWKRTREILLRPPWLFALLLIAYAFLSTTFAPLRGKAIAYSLWLCFDLIAVVFTAYLAFETDSDRIDTRVRNLALWARYMTAAVIVIALIVHIDYFAHFYGYKSGLIGYNQGNNEWYVNSRPHAFSFEPSYLALFFAFSIIYLAFEAAVAARPLLPRWIATIALVLSLIGFISLLLALVLAIAKETLTAGLLGAGLLLFAAVSGLIGYLTLRKKPLEKTQERVREDVAILADHLV